MVRGLPAGVKMGPKEDNQPSPQRRTPSKKDLAGAVPEMASTAASAHICIHLFHYGKDMSIFGFPFTNSPGVQMRVIYKRRPNPFYMMTGKMEEYCACVGKNSEFPQSFRELEEVYKFKWIFVGDKDFDNTNFMVKNSLAFYL